MEYFVDLTTRVPPPPSERSQHRERPGGGHGLGELPGRRGVQGDAGGVPVPDGAREGRA